MCIAAVKYFGEVGWVGCKNRDRAYKPEIKIKQSYSKGMERLLIWDSKTHWSEGVNEFGIAILSSATAVKEDEAEANINTDSAGNLRNYTNDANGFSNDGVLIRKALFGKTLDEVKDICIDLKLVGNTYIFNKDKCYLIESGYDEPSIERHDIKFKYNVKVIDKDKVSVRTNHGLDLKWNGYQHNKSDAHKEEARKSSEVRYKKVVKALKKIDAPEKMLDALSDMSSDSNGQMNPIRTSKTHGSSILVTTGQIQITPSANLLSYRPIWCNVVFDFDKLDKIVTKTYFEIISKRNLLALNKNFVKKNVVKESFDTLLQKAYKDLLNG